MSLLAWVLSLWREVMERSAITDKQFRKRPNRPKVLIDDADFEVPEYLISKHSLHGASEPRARWLTMCLPQASILQKFNLLNPYTVIQD